MNALRKNYIFHALNLIFHENDIVHKNDQEIFEKEAPKKLDLKELLRKNKDIGSESDESD